MPYRIHNFLREARARTRTSLSAKASDVYASAKEYPRMPKLALPRPAPLKMSLEQALSARRSSHDTSGVLSLADIGTLLGHALGVRTDGSRHYPSGGGAYPVETYVLSGAIDYVPSAVLHYHPLTHSLEHLWDIETRPLVFQNSIISWADSAAALIILTANWNKAAQYREFAYSLGMLETGHVAQNILLVATACGLSSCSLGGFSDDVVYNMLDIDATREQVVHVIAVGRPENPKGGAE